MTWGRRTYKGCGVGFLYRTSFCIGSTLFAPFVRFRTLGLEHFPAEGAVILAANHFAYFDPPFIIRVTPREIDWMAMVELFGNRWIAAWMRGHGVFPVNRAKADRQAIKTALARLEAGRVVGIFPEGGFRTVKDSILTGAEMQPGVSALAQMSGAPVIVCGIVGSARLWDWKAWLLPGRRSTVTIAFDAPFHCAGKDKAARLQFETELSERFRNMGKRLGIPS